jgi:hypothetical protein
MGQLAADWRSESYKDRLYAVWADELTSGFQVIPLLQRNALYLGGHLLLDALRAIGQRLLLLSDGVQLRLQLGKDASKRQAAAKASCLGPVLSQTLVAAVPELGTLNKKKIAALIGVAPINRDSGSMRRHARAGAGVLM